MFELTKSVLDLESFINYPITSARSQQFVSVNKKDYLFDGYSKVVCVNNDKFSARFGRELAETNAQIDMLKQYKSFLIKQTKQPEWKKEIEPKTETATGFCARNFQSNMFLSYIHGSNKPYKSTEDSYRLATAKDGSLWCVKPYIGTHLKDKE